MFDGCSAGLFVRRARLDPGTRSGLPPDWPPDLPIDSTQQEPAWEPATTVATGGTMATAEASLFDLPYWQGARYRPDQSRGHYESWFLRANHPARQLAFWIRYTIFVPAGRPQDAIGELWAIQFDGERRLIRAAKSEIPLTDCQFAPHGLDVRIGSATLSAGALNGSAGGAHHISWALAYRDGGMPMIFL